MPDFGTKLGIAEANAGRLLVMDGDRLAGLITRSAVDRLVQMRMALGGQPAAAADA